METSLMSRNVARLSCATLSEAANMNDQQELLILTVMEMIGDTLDNYENDEFHAPAPWILENWWNTLNSAIEIERLTSSNLSEEP